MSVVNENTVNTNTQAWIRLRALTINDASVGALPHERDVRQLVRLDAAMLIDNTRPGHSDALRDTVDYGKIAETLRAVTKSRHFVLIENLAEHLARAVLENFNGVQRVSIEVHKPNALTDGNVSVSVERSR